MAGGGEEDLAMADAASDEENDDEHEVRDENPANPGGKTMPKAMAPAIISIHPSSRIVVVCVGAGFRVFDLEKNEALNPDCGHRAAVRACGFSTDGVFFVSAGDDKLVKLWDTQSWKCSKTVLVNKKISAVTFSRDGRWLFVADKFGVVYVIPTLADDRVDKDEEEPSQLLAHCCSIITSLETSHCGKFVVTADRDYKIRVSVLPKDPVLGAYEIQSFCLGHTSFVSCLAFVSNGSSPPGALLISGGGDSTIRLWSYVSGDLLDAVDVPGVLQIERGDNFVAPAVVNISASGSVAAATIERLNGVLLLRCDFDRKKLQFLQKISWQEPICPTGLQFDSRERLWLVAGAAETREIGDRALKPEQVAEMTSLAQASAAAALTRVRVAEKSSSSSSSLSYEVLDDAEAPGGDAMLRALQGSPSDSSVSVAAAVAEAAEAAELAMKNLLSKRQYTESHRERRKRTRNDKKALLTDLGSKFSDRE